ncbi:nicotinamidase-related amidase [Saccharothrix coeruleofusca]|uniref:isochorismatase family protein n=1 Tax=Saccharothrix coeruleofusca TaxID=33919 RepID=UPI001AE0EEA5|nr:isochorismatase family protein [Saccharothrix coeruleofusca]MBP2336644.1 nicotinamidase-related amidase [Saccharothrix coeruleofusca]
MTARPRDELDAATSALVLVDFQRGVVDGLGAGVPLGPHPAAEAVANARRVAVALRRRGGLVVLVRGSMGRGGVPFPAPRADVELPPPGGAPAEWTEVVPELADLGSHVVVKHQWGSFYGTELDPLLRRRGVRTVLFGGIATNLGVESAAREAYDRGYEQVLVRDAATAFDAGAHEDAIARVFSLIGRVRTADEVIDALAPPA